jgi:trehalose 2-sulfotransferase
MTLLIAVEFYAQTLYMPLRTHTVMVVIMIKSSYLICATYRTGSTLLAEALISTGIAGNPREYFDAERHSLLVDQLNIAPGDVFLDSVLTAATTANGVFGAKICWPQTENTATLLGRPEAFGERPDDILSEIFPNLRYIWVVRQDKVRQAVSLFRARKSQRWWDIPGREQEPIDDSALRPVFDFAEIDILVHEITSWHMCWQRYFEQRSIVPLTITYEYFQDNYEATVLSVLQYLEIPLSPDFTVSPPHLQRQADALSEDVIAKYYAAIIKMGIHSTWHSFRK